MITYAYSTMGATNIAMFPPINALQGNGRVSRIKSSNYEASHFFRGGRNSPNDWLVYVSIWDRSKHIQSISWKGCNDHKQVKVKPLSVCYSLLRALQ